MAADAALAVLLFGAALVSSWASIEAFDATDPAYEPPNTVQVAVGLAATILPLTLRRRLPLVALLASIAGFVVARVALDSVEAPITGIALSLAFYSAGANGRERWRNWVCAAGLVAVAAELWREVSGGFGPGVPNEPLLQALALVVNVALLSAMWALGAAVGSGRRQARELRERTVALEREREDKARRAVFDERVRIARELHDVVAHHVSIMGVQAGAARMVMGRDPSKATEALASIEDTSRHAVVELHRLLGFLRQEGDGGGLAPQPTLRQLDDLATQLGGAELAVEVRIEGERQQLPPTIEVSAYRIVQEALTNTLKHSGASKAEVVLRYRLGELEVEIVDDGQGPGAGPARGAGLGIVGMRERASLHGGRLAAGSAPGGGFVVLATFPLDGRA